MKKERVGQDSSTLLFDVWALANATHALVDDALTGSGLTAHEFALYSVLKAPGGRTPTEIALALQIPRTTVSSIVRKLEERGHVQRDPDPNDRRSYRVNLSPEGRSTHQRARKAFLPVLSAVEKNLDCSVADARHVLNAIDRAVRDAAGSIRRNDRRERCPANG